MATQLTSTNVQKMFTKCLHTNEEVKDLGISKENIPEGYPVGRGIMNTVIFHPGRLEESKLALVEMIRQLPDDFHKNKGGGMSFLNMCVDKDGTQWGEHPTMDQLITLAIAAGVGHYCMPRENWGIFPGGMPYVMFDTETPSA